MQKVLTAAEMREIDRLTTERYGIPSVILMENAAHAVARVITEKLGGSVKGKRILILCGKGSNGGDGAALARILAVNGARSELILFARREVLSGDSRINFEIAHRLANGRYADRKPDPKSIFFTSFFFPSFGEVRFEECDDVEIWNELIRPGQLDDYDAVVDAIFGSGFIGEINTFFSTIFDEYNKLATRQDDSRKMPLLISVDIPSGISADVSQDLAKSIESDITVTFTAPKPGNVLPSTSRFNGELIIANIGSPQELIDEQPSQLYLAEQGDAATWLKRTAFSSDSYKNKRGHALLIAGSENYSGAAVLAANAAMRSGVGLVTLVTPGSSKASVESRVLPEVMVRGAAETDSGAIAEDAFDELGDLFDKADAIAIGSGMSQGESTAAFVLRVVAECRQPLILDADALNVLAPFGANWPPADAGGSDIILTPHEGEFLRLLGDEENHPVGETPPTLLRKEGSLIKDRVAAVREFSQKHNVILVLKGERVLIGEPGGKVVVNPTGNSGLGKAGNGDTLAGILAGFVAQAAKMNIDIFETVVAAVYVAGMAGDIAEKKFGKRVMTASDVRECLVEAFAKLEKG
ncbi:MAG: NAD(P)H-hydrate dehydratase [Acidobacteria bacterium]|nr:NAD(P)H-hydrate dehydratase [Acidobacteriota bacterium]